jgi:hypothetical protein
MEWKPWFSGSKQVKIETLPAQIDFSFHSDVQSLDTTAVSLGRHLFEYIRMMALFTRLYYENRVIAAQNFVLSCKLQVWALVFVSFKIQIFLTRLACGFPVSECWPRR